MTIRHHILVVGDEELRGSLCSGTCAGDTMVSPVTNLDEARCFIENRKVDLIVSALELPDGCGTELIEDQDDSFRVMIVGQQEEVGPAVLEKGAIEYLVRSDESLRSLPRVIESRASDWAGTLARKHSAQKRDHLVAIWEATPDFVGTTDVDGFFLHLNAQGRKMIGLGEDEDVTRLRLFDIHDEEGSNRLITEGLSHAVNRGVWCAESVLVTLEGETVPVSSVLIAHKSQSGGVTHFSTILHDLTAVRASEEERKRLAEDLHQAMKMESIGRLAGGVAHDLNNRLTAIIGYAELGLLEAMSDKPSKHELEMIIESCEKASGLIEQLVTFSRKQAVKPSFINMNDVVTDVVEMLRNILGEGIELETDLDSGLWPVIFDRSQFEQVIVNLVTNGRDAITGSGTIVVKTSNRVVDWTMAAELGVQEPGDFVVLDVSDSGEPVDEKMREHVFEPFYSLSTHGRDGGLGLSSVYGAVTQNRGVVTVGDSDLGGSRFEVYLPREGASSD